MSSSSRVKAFIVERKPVTGDAPPLNRPTPKRGIELGKQDGTVVFDRSCGVFQASIELDRWPASSAEDWAKPTMARPLENND